MPEIVLHSRRLGTRLPGAQLSYRTEDEAQGEDSW